jgi:hypothetical protein
MHNKPFNVDDRPYEVTVTPVLGKIDEPIDLRITLRADYGHRSFCIFRGLQNYGYYWNYGYWNLPEDKQIKTIEITPRVIADLIRLAHIKGWSPDASKSNVEYTLENDAIMIIPDRYQRIIEVLEAKGFITYCRDLRHIMVAHSKYEDGKLTCYNRMIHFLPVGTDQWKIQMPGFLGGVSPTFSEEEILEMVPEILSSDSAYEDFRKRWFKPRS